MVIVYQTYEPGLRKELRITCSFALFSFCLVPEGDKKKLISDETPSKKSFCKSLCARASCFLYVASLSI